MAMRWVNRSRVQAVRWFHVPGRMARSRVSVCSSTVRRKRTPAGKASAGRALPPGVCYHQRPLAPPLFTQLRGSALVRALTPRLLPALGVALTIER